MIIREADPKDAQGIHDAHMNSIQEVCSSDYSPEQIQAWGHREFNEAKWMNAITNQHVWVAENENHVVGFGHIHVFTKDEKTSAHIFGLYLTKATLRLGIGRKIIQRMVKFAYESGADSITLNSTLTSHPFYLKMGFEDVGPQSATEINGVAIPSIPMKLELYTH